jgi:PIN domain nuclease of toxin-antitoxin system
MKPAVLDSSAVIALLMAEPGEERVRERLSGAMISSVNLAEVVAYLARRRANRDAIMETVGSLPIEVVAFDAELATAAGMLVAAAREAGLSLGDCACLALAASRGAEALTADRAWRRIVDRAGVDIVVIR